ncbi:MAG: insulinase family protein [Proteobacteria bacterium]|nr:insulinase family protein [Pseudomonadota bacterium]
MTDPNNPHLSENGNILGYQVIQKKRLKEINAYLYELAHKKTGARHIHISRKDTENAFAVAFKTIPKDATGVAHILEHTVLCGSKKYPVRDPFFSMIKRSLNTFMNAFTSSDWTMYPFSTENRTDFYNLLGIYLDATFFPLIDELSFKQEGHRIEIENEEENGNITLALKGIVYNEMKGAMSSPSQVMVRSLLNALYPDTTYSNNSGGDPLVIPDLTYEQLKKFHEVHYHPSNAFFYTYGDMPLENHLALIEQSVLTHFSKIDPDTDVPHQKRWKKPKEKTYTYPIGAHESDEKKAQFCLAWLMADTTSSFEVLSLIVLEHILLGNPASPLRKALIDSELGSSLSDGTGFDSENRDTMFACGLKNVSPESASDIETIIFDILNHLAKEGIDKSLIESAIHQIEFHKKEITNSPYPYGIKIMMWIVGIWMHGGDPANALLIDKDLERLSLELKKGPFLENQIQKYFIENTHCIKMTLIPDKEMTERDNRKISEKLEKIKSGLQPSDLEKIREDSQKLTLLQETKEDLSCLPTLGLDEIPPQIKTVDATREVSEPPLFCYHQSTSGIFYYSSIAETGMLPDKLIEMAPFFATSFSKTGTKKHSYVELARMIDAKTGGIGLSTHVRTRYDGSEACMPFISFSGKCLNRNIAAMVGILDELLLAFSFEDHKRLNNLLREYQAAIESALIQNGHRLAISLSCRKFSKASDLSETWHGVRQLQFIKQINQDLTDEKLDAFAKNLYQIGEILFNRDNYKIAIVGEAESMAHGSEKAGELQNKLPKRNGNPPDIIDAPVQGDIIHEGWYTQSAVSFVAKSFEVVKLGHGDAPSLSLISKILKSLYLHREIREKGGAYGGLAMYNAEDGLFSFASYRDPHIVATLNAFHGACDFIRQGNYSDEDIKEAILQVCSEIDKPETPGFAARKAFFRKMVGLSDDTRKAYKEGLLGLSKKDILETAEKYFNPETMRASVAVISGKDKLEEANQKLDEDVRLTLNAI